MKVVEQVQDLTLTWNKQYWDFMKYITKMPLINVSTLGPSGTSSEAAAKYFLSTINGKSGDYTLFPTYEKAYQELVTGNSSILLVANAYERIDRIYMSQETQFLFPFIYETPL